MKIAIKGNSDRGKEIIQILESLDGVNKYSLNGKSTVSYYYIDYNSDNTIRCYDSNYVNKYCKKYTLEEFEKEFPFKVGDVVFHKGHKAIVEMFVPRENCYYIRYNNPPIDGIYYTKWTTAVELKMKEERNITLTLDKAKEWYNKGGELREIALQAFTEKELNPLPKSWEEFCEKYPTKKGECWIGSQDTIYSAIFTQDRIYKNWIPSRRSAKSHLAMIQLEQLRNCWWGDWEPKYDCGTKYIIKWDKDDLIVATSGRIRAFLIFPTREMAEEFLECFRNLIKQAGDLI